MLRYLKEKKKNKQKDQRKEGLENKKGRRTKEDLLPTFLKPKKK
jgi:hypothetical protein